jgi:tRNA threonylcarbamoyladenosine biosynthesis protein TsaB
VLTPQDLVQYLGEQITPQLGEVPAAPYLFCGEISAVSRQALAESMPEQAFFGSTLQSARRASVLASLAWQRLEEQCVDDPLLLEPLYIRRPSITSSTRKQPLLGHKAHQINQHSTEGGEGALRH